MRRLLSLVIALPLCLILAAPASALTPENGTYKGSGKSTCVTDPVKRKKAPCGAKVTVTVKRGKVTVARLDWSVRRRADAVIVELGANDALRGVDPEA